MASENYQSLFEIHILHTYFEKGFGDHALQVLPSQNTLKLINQYHLIMTTNGGIYRLFASTDSNLQGILEDIEATTSVNYFDFVFDIKDPDFYVYTELPLNEDNTYLFDSDSFNNIETTNGTFLTPAIVPKQHSFGEIRIYFHDILDSINNLAVFTIEFQARATRWDYYIINNSNLNLEGVSIETNEDFQFRGATQVLLENGQEALFFSSGETQLVLSEVSKYRFNLVNLLADGTTEKIISKLPVPNPLQFKMYQENGINKLSSPMYIYV